MTKRARLSGHRGARDAIDIRLDDAQAAFEAIGRGEVDAVMVSGPDGPRTLTLDGAAHPYHALLHAMSDGAALLNVDGAMLFGNRRLGEMARAPRLDWYGRTLQQIIVEHERAACEAELRDAVARPGTREFVLRGADGSTTPVSIAFSTLSPGSYPAPTSRDHQTGGAHILMAIVTDLTARKATEALRAQLMQRVISAEDDERRKIARGLHDETGQSLTALLVGIRAIEDRASLKDARAIAARLRILTARTIDDVGRLARGLHPSVLDDLGLAAAATRYVRDYATAHGIATTLHAEGLHDHRLTPLSETTVYRVLQEALTNVARHARARSLEVRLAYDGVALSLDVRDDGCGFDVGQMLRQTSHMGLHGMLERVTLLDGLVDIASQPGRGTEVRVSVPASVVAATA